MSASRPDPYDRTRSSSDSPLRAFAPIAALVLGAGLLSWAALYNGYPLTFWDTRVYLEHAATLLPRPDRLVGYSVWLRALSWGVTLWPVALAQWLLIAWLVRRALHAIAGELREREYLSLMLGLAVGTALPFVAGQLMADVFTPVLVISLWLLTSGAALGRFERTALCALCALCVCVHLTHLPLGLALLLCAGARAALAREGRVFARLLAPALALALGLSAIAGFNYVRGGRLTLASGSNAFLLAHMVESGLASTLLDEHCPERGYLLCPHRARLPMSTDEFLWVDRLELEPWTRTAAISQETRRLLRDSLREHPLQNLRVAFHYSFASLFRFRTGEGLDSDARYLIEPLVQRYAPADLAAYRSARQQHDGLPIAAINRLHAPVGWALFGLALCASVAGLRHGRTALRAPALSFLLFVLASLVLNAILSGNLSGIYDRYESRLWWLLGLALFARQLIVKRDENRQSHPVR